MKRGRGDRWRGRLIPATAVAHLAALVVWIVRPEAWPWIVGVLLVNHALLVWGSLWPRSALVGANLRRVRAADGVALTFDDGPDPEVTPHVLDILDRYRARATFFCIGHKAAENPALVADIAGRGHEVGNHTQRHPHLFCFYAPGAMAEEIELAQRTLTAASGSRPRWFRAPAGLRNPWLAPVLRRSGLTLVSWSHRAFDTVTSDVDRLYGRLARGLVPGGILLLHDGTAARSADGQPAVLRVLPRLLDELERRGLRAIALGPERGSGDG